MTRFLSALLLLAAAPAAAQPNSAWGRTDDDAIVMVVHGGAGDLPRASVRPATDAGLRAGIERALRAGYALLVEGGSAVDAVVAAIEILEDDTLFNAGRGAVLTHDSTVRHDASIMDGRTGLAGASAGTTIVRHPIALARDVMLHSPHVMLAGRGAERFARVRGLELVPSDFFVTARARRSLQAALQAERDAAARDSTTRGDAGPVEVGALGTVGAVALEQAGHLAAGTSTGGMTNKRWDRIGDSPIIGAGTYARDATCGVSSTGHGEYFIRLAVAHDIHARAAYLGETCAQAARHVVDSLTQQPAEGGVITLDTAGEASTPSNTSFMARGTITRGGVVTVYLYADEGR